MTKDWRQVLLRVLAAAALVRWEVRARYVVRRGEHRASLS